MELIPMHPEIIIRAENVGEAARMSWLNGFGSGWVHATYLREDETASGRVEIRLSRKAPQPMCHCVPSLSIEDAIEMMRPKPDGKGENPCS